ncbi:hypothetical protein AQUCO_00400152v1 [Aquilegia coerulea]|uniref:EF-hand domain-containing protein n=1 Tax=Aquilegia coerulea TaxID=218851 RepID=A0A2G5ETL8_AQUCA|nr:hypothetical protein AQUCO_00400152v1 [Aquilegia coerulea]
MDSSYKRYSSSSSQNYVPSAPSLPDNYIQEQQQQQQPFSSPSLPTYNNGQQHQQYSSSSHSYNPSYGGQSNYSQSSYGQPNISSYGQQPGYGYSIPPTSYGGFFPPGTSPEIIRSFEMVDKDRSGFIDEGELQEALSFGYHKFSLRTIQLLMFLFKNPRDSLKIGPNEFSALWKCLGEWRAIFARFDRDRSGKIDTLELRDALYSLGYAVPSSVLQVLISKYDDGNGRRGELNFDSFVECGMIVKVTRQTLKYI